MWQQARGAHGSPDSPWPMSAHQRTLHRPWGTERNSAWPPTLHQVCYEVVVLWLAWVGKSWADQHEGMFSSQETTCNHFFVLSGPRGRPGPRRGPGQEAQLRHVQEGAAVLHPCTLPSQTLRELMILEYRLRGAGFPAHRW